jgi:hypothetical protein
MTTGDRQITAPGHAAQPEERSVGTGRRRRVALVLLATAFALGILLLVALNVVLGLNAVTFVADTVGLTPTRFVSSFEDGEFKCRLCQTDGWAVRNNSTDTDAIRIVGSDHPQRDGDYSLLIHAEKDDAWDPNPKLELSASAQPFFEIGTEYWMGWSVYLPDDGGYEFDSQYQEVLLQIHGWNDACDPGGVGPPHALRPIDGRWRWDVRWDPNECMGPEPAGQEIIDMGPQERGKWTDFVVRFVFSSDDTGITQVWRDEELVVDRVGMPNHYNNEKGPYMKLGFYKAGWLNNPTDVTTRTLYVDAIRVYEGSDGYAAVDPAQGA